MRWYFGKEGWPTSSIVGGVPQSEQEQATLIDTLQVRSAAPLFPSSLPACPPQVPTCATLRPSTFTHAGMYDQIAIDSPASVCHGAQCQLQD